MQLNRQLKSLIVYLLMVVLVVMSIEPYHVYGGSGISTNKAEIEEFYNDGIQYFRFYVSSTASNSKYKYKTIGWNMEIKPHNSTTVYKGFYPYTFSQESSNNPNDKVELPLQKMFDYINDPEPLPQIYREIGGNIEVDAKQQLLVNGEVKGEYSEDSSKIINAIYEKYGIQWSPDTQKDLTTYYDIKEPYDPVSEDVDISLEVERMSTVDDQTLDMSKGEGSAQVRIHASGTVKPDPVEQKYATDYNNIQSITVALKSMKKTQTKVLYPNVDFTSLDYSTDFSFTYLPVDIEDGDADMNDTMIEDYHASVDVVYKLQYKGNAIDDTSAVLTKKAPIPDGEPLAILSVPDQVLVDEEILADGSGSIAPDGATIVNYKWQVESVDKPSEDGNSSIKLSYSDPKTVTIALTVEDSNGKSDTAMKDVVVKKKASPPINWSPDVSISAPTVVMQGDDFTLNVNANDKEDGMLTPILSKPSYLVLNSAVKNGDNTVRFTESGTFSVTAKATDSGGKSDSASVQIEVCPPKPLAIISENGDYKIGQTVILDSSKSKAVSKTYPIDWSLTKWEITPLSGLTESDIYYKKLNDKEIAFTSKKTGNVRISLTVTNTLGYSNTRTIDRTIVSDTAPIADFKLIKKLYRDKDNEKKAILRAFDASTSPDGDTITKRAWFYAFDADNDGIFSDDVWYYHNGTEWVNTNTNYTNLFNFADSVETGNSTDVSVETTHVGKYKFELKIYEEHDNRLLEFVDTSYILVDDTLDKPGEECIAEVDNIAPVTAVKVDVSKDEVYDIVVVTDYKDMNLIQLQTELNLLKAEAFANNKEFKIHMITDKVKTGQQHKIKNYYRYARMIYLRYYLGSGSYQCSTGTYTYKTYNHDLRTSDIEYETTQGYTTPTKAFEKGDNVEWTRTSFSRSHENPDLGTGYSYSGVEFQFYNPDNKVGTMVTRRETTNGWHQGMGFAQVWNGITVVDETVNVTNYWTQRPSPAPHDFYYDVEGVDFSKTKDIAYTNDSKKIFLYFTNGTDFDYENVNDNNYSATSLTKDFLDYLTYNDFETYVVAPNEEVLDLKFDNNNHSTDINTQYANLRELSHCSSIRGKYIINDAAELWKDQLMHITKKNVLMPNNVSVENNVIRLTFDESFKEGEELDLTLIQEEIKISDIVGNTFQYPKIDYKITVEDKGIKNLSSLCFTNPLAIKQLSDDIEIVKVMDDLMIYKKDGKFKIVITNETSASNRFTASVLSEIKNIDYSNVKDIHAVSNLIAVHYNDGSVKGFGHVYAGYYSKYELDVSKWRNIKKLISKDTFLVGIKYDGSMMQHGVYSNTHRINYEIKNTSNYFDGYVVRSMIFLLYKASDGNKYVYGLGNGLPLLPYRIEDIYHTTNYEIITNPSSYEIYVKLNGVYYLAKSDYYNPLERIDELNGMSIKKLIPVTASYTNGFIAIKSDDSIYFSQSIRDKYSSLQYYPEITSKMNSLGKFKRAVNIGSYLWLEGTNGEFFFENNTGNKTYQTRYLDIDDINRVIHNGNSMIFIMKDGKRYDMTNSVNSLKVPSSATYYMVDNYGIAYMTSNGYFNSSLIPQYNQSGYSNYHWRNVSGYYDKVVSLGLNIALIGIKNGRGYVYRKNDDYFNYLGNINYYTDIKDIFYLHGIVLLIRENDSITPVYRGNINTYLDYYHHFSGKGIVKYITGKVTGVDRLLGLDKNGDVWCTDPNNLLKVTSNVEDMFNIGGELVYLKKDGTLSQFGDGKIFEKYDNMLITPKFITLKLKGSDDKACVSKNGTQVGYVGDLKDRLEIVEQLKSTQFHIGKHLDDGVAFKYKIFTADKASIEELLYNQEIDDTWINVKDLDIIAIEDGVYIGVVEVNSQNRAIRYSYMKSKAENM